MTAAALRLQNLNSPVRKVVGHARPNNKAEHGKTGQHRFKFIRTAAPKMRTD